MSDDLRKSIEGAVAPVTDTILSIFAKHGVVLHEWQTLRPSADAPRDGKPFLAAADKWKPPYNFVCIKWSPEQNDFDGTWIYHFVGRNDVVVQFDEVIAGWLPLPTSVEKSPR